MADASSKLWLQQAGSASLFLCLTIEYGKVLNYF